MMLLLSFRCSSSWKLIEGDGLKVAGSGLACLSWGMEWVQGDCCLKIFKTGLRLGFRLVLGGVKAMILSNATARRGIGKPDTEATRARDAKLIPRTGKANCKCRI